MSARIRRTFNLAPAVLALALAFAAAPSRAATPQLPVPVTKTLGNGLRVVVFPDHRLPLVNFTLEVPAGLTAEPTGAEGLAYVTAEMLQHGTSSRDAAAFHADLARTGGALSSNVGQDATTFGGTFLASQFDAALELASDAVIYPVFEPEQLDYVRGYAARLLVFTQQNPAAWANDHLWRFTFAGHPYGHPLHGTLQSLPVLAPATVHAFWIQHYRPEHSVLAIAGDVTPDHAFQMADEWFGRWNGKGGEAPTPAAPAPGARVRIRVVDRPGPRTELRIGAVAAPRGPDQSALLVASTLYDGLPQRHPGGIDTRFGNEVSASYLPLASSGLFSISLSAPSDSVAAAVKSLLDPLRALATPPAAADLDQARQLLENLFPVSLQTLAATTANWLAADAGGDPQAAFAGYFTGLDAVTPEAVATAARRWLDPAHVVIVAVGPAATLRRQLARFGTVELAPPDLPENGPGADSTLAPSRAAATPIAATAAQRARGKQLVDRMIAAHGGLTRLRGIRDSRWDANTTLDVAGRRLDGRMALLRREPNQMIMITDVAGIATRQVLNGSHGWQYSTLDSIPRDVDLSTLAALRAGYNSDLQHLLLAAREPAARVWAGGRAAIDSISALVVYVEAPGSARRIYYLDPVSYRLIAFDQTESGPGGDLTSRRRFSEFQPIDGILWPFQERRLLNGETVMTVNVLDLRFNTGIAPSLFEKPIAGSTGSR